MKSLFHWCEGFFYLSSGDESFEKQEPGDVRNRPDLAFSPWFHEDDKWHSKWRSFDDQERDALRSHLARMGLLPTSRWFCLWIPLRIALRDAQEVTGVAPIVPEFPGDLNSDAGLKAVFGSNPISELSTVLPMLRHLQKVRIWEDDGFEVVCLYEVEFSRGERSCRPRGGSWPPAADLFKRLWSGSICVKSKGAEGAFEFSGAERLFVDDELAEIHQDDRWPKTSDTDARTFAVEPKKVRRTPHAAAYFVRDPNRRSKPEFRIWQAAYLPLGDKPIESIELPGGDADFSLVLHGDFFPDASRSQLKLPSRGEDRPDVAHRWNRRLLDVGTLPLILNALERFAAHESEETVLHITSGIKGSQLFQKDRRVLCDSRQWAYCLEERPPRWKLTDAAADVHPMPEGPLVQQLFPSIAEVLGPGRHATPHQHPRLHPNLDDMSPWSDELAARMIRSVSTQFVFGDRARLVCMVQFLGLLKGGDVVGSQLEEELCILAYDAYRQVGALNLAKLGASFSDFPAYPTFRGDLR